MVAAAIDEPAMIRTKSWMLLAVTVIALAATLGLQRFANLVGLAPLDKSPDALIENAQQIAARLGYAAPAADTAFFAATDRNQVSYLADHEDSRVWRRTLRDAYPAVHQFWWRQSPRPMRTMTGWIDEENPAPTVPGMLTVRMDQRGRLLRFAAVPPDFEPAPVTPNEPNWALLFDAAGLPLTSLHRHRPSGSRQWRSTVRRRGKERMAHTCCKCRRRASMDGLFIFVWPAHGTGRKERRDRFFVNG
jgi:hypothetical protein